MPRKRRKARFRRVLQLKASGGGRSLTLEPRDPEQNIRSQTILFPSPLETKVDALVQPRIEADWVKQAVKKAHDLGRKEAKGPGDARMPVAITTRFDNGSAVLHRRRHLRHRLQGERRRPVRRHQCDAARPLAGRAGQPRKAQARLDALWKARGVG